MGILEQLSDALRPHSDRLNSNLNEHGRLLHYRLKRIEDSISQLGRPDIGDTYYRHMIRGKFPIGESDVIIVKMNEFYPIQFITINGLTKKTPAFTILAGGALIFAFNAEGVGTETVGGDIVLLPGEKVTINMSAEGEVEACLCVTRVEVPKQEQAVNYGVSEELLVGTNVHEVNRDVIASPNGEWVESPPETIDSGGRPVITR